jgi:outer membrane lipase/esterase
MHNSKARSFVFIWRDKMRTRNKWVLSASMAALLVAGLAGCGGSPTANKVYVVGDSLNDVGVFDTRFTVKSIDTSNPYRVWTEHVASGVEADYPCAAYAGLQGFAAKSGCTGYAVGGAQINPATVSLSDPGRVVTSVTIDSDASPFSIIQQIKDAGKSSFSSVDMVLVDGGGNDANALANTLFQGFSGNPIGTAGYKTILKDLLPASVVDPVVDPTGLANLGGAYMQTAATMLANAIKTELIAKNVHRVVVMNLPDLSKTPGLSTAPASVKAIAAGWAQAFNAQLQTELGSESKVLIVDFYGKLNDWVADPSSAKLGLLALTNVTDRACGTTSARDCQESVLNVSGPSDWRTHLFVDDLHATPFANQLVATWVLGQIKAKGW